MMQLNRSIGQNKTLEKRHIGTMLKNFEEYELIKKGLHSRHRYVKDFFVEKSICSQNFHKYYNRYLLSSRDINQLLPKKRGAKFKEAEELYSKDLLDKIKAHREKGYNRYEIATILRKVEITISASTIYRLTRKMGISRLNTKIKLEVRKIVKQKVGELAHIDLHHLSRDVVKGSNKKLYLAGIIDDYSRVCWLEVIESARSLDVMFASFEIFAVLRQRYGIEFTELMSDNGSEFSSKNNVSNHPFERLLAFMGVKHRYTKPYRPQTNGKIERFWKTIDNELLDGEQFESIDKLREFIIAYCIYYNEERIHQGINCKVPKNMLSC